MQSDLVTERAWWTKASRLFFFAALPEKKRGNFF